MTIYRVEADTDAEVNDVPVAADTMAELLTLGDLRTGLVGVAFDTGIFNYDATLTDEPDNVTIWRPDAIAGASPGRWVLVSPGAELLLGLLDEVQDLLDAASNPPMCMYTRSTALTLVDSPAAATDVIFDTPVFPDSLGEYDPTTGILTSAAGGVYEFTFYAQDTGAYAGLYRVRTKLTGVAKTLATEHTDAAVQGVHWTLGFQAFLRPGESYGPFALQTPNAASVLNGGETANHLIIRLVKRL